MIIDTIKWTLSIAIYVGMVVLCVLRADWAGIGAVAGSALGFLWRAWSPGQDSVSERLGNGYVGLLIGMCVGLAVGAVVQYAWPYIETLR
jgi:hypothetical protein